MKPSESILMFVLFGWLILVVQMFWDFYWFAVGLFQSKQEEEPQTEITQQTFDLVDKIVLGL